MTELSFIDEIERAVAADEVVLPVFNQTALKIQQELIKTEPDNQLIERLVRLYSDPGDVVFSPFAGIGSELATALLLGRRGYGCEIKPEYHAAAVRNCDAAIRSRNQANYMPLFDAFGDGRDRRAGRAAAWRGRLEWRTPRIARRIKNPERAIL